MRQLGGVICKTATARSRIRFDEGHGSAARATGAVALLLHSQLAINHMRGFRTTCDRFEYALDDKSW